MQYPSHTEVGTAGLSVSSWIPGSEGPKGGGGSFLHFSILS